MLRNTIFNILVVLLFVGGFLLFFGAGTSMMVDMVAGDAPAAPAAAEADVSATGPADAAALSGAMLVADGGGHFRAPALVNGQSVTMIVDTGASTVVLTEADARLVGLAPAPSQFTGRATTAAGSVAVAPITIERLSVNGVERRNVAAVVAQGTALPASLLGQSYLSQLGEVRIADGRMTLRD